MAELAIVSEQSMAESSGSQPAAAGCCYLCNQCPAAFSSLPDLESHLQSHTEGGDAAQSPEQEEEEMDDVNSPDGHDNSPAEMVNSPASPHSLSIYSDTNVLDDSKINDDDDSQLYMDLESEDVVESDDVLLDKPGARMFTCRFCSKLFQSRSQLNIHYTHTHRDKPQYECEHCGKIFSVKRELATHRRIHSGEQTHRCTQCGKEFGTRQLLKKHWMWHTGQRSHVCPHCSKAFFQKGHLTQHLMIHAGGRPHVCNLCTKTFIFKFDLNRHMKIHAERGFNCAKCAKSFIKQSLLVDHESQCDGRRETESVQSTHSSTTVVDNPPTMTHINRLSSQMPEQSEHKSPQKQRVLCIFCMQDFASQAAYAVHFSLVHSRHAANMITQQQALAFAANASMYTGLSNFAQKTAAAQSSADAPSVSQPCAINATNGFNFLQPPQIKLESPNGAVRAVSDDDSESSPVKFASSSNGSSEGPDGPETTDAGGRASQARSDVSAGGHYCPECNCANPKLGLAIQRLTELQRILTIKEGELDRLKDQMNRVGFVAGGLLESCSEFDKLWMLHSKKVYSQIQAVLNGLE